MFDSAAAAGDTSLASFPGTPVRGGQRTLKTEIGCVGEGLHSGRRVRMALRPAPAGTGIRLRRVDLAGDAALIPARWDHVVDTRLCTVLGNRHDVRVATVEHVLAALSGLGIDNAEIAIDGPELPVMDGSAAPFVFLIECAGAVEQPAPRRAIRILKRVEVADGESRAALLPGGGFGVEVTIDFASRAIGRQHCRWRAAPGAFKGEVARARTFGFYEEVEQLRRNGLALGGSLDNAVVVDGDRVLNPEGLRFGGEFVRHKVLDVIGDLALAGAPIVGRYVGERPGHRLNNNLLRALFADRSAWTWVREAPDEDEAASSAA